MWQLLRAACSSYLGLMVDYGFISFQETALWVIHHGVTRVAQPIVKAQGRVSSRYHNYCDTMILFTRIHSYYSFYVTISTMLIVTTLVLSMLLREKYQDYYYQGSCLLA